MTGEAPAVFTGTLATPSIVVWGLRPGDAQAGLGYAFSTRLRPLALAR